MEIVQMFAYGQVVYLTIAIVHVGLNWKQEGINA